MRTENDLRDAFLAAAQNTPLAEGIVQQVTRRAVRRRRLRGVASFTAVLVLIGLLIPLGVTVLGPNHDIDHDPGQTPTPARSTTATPGPSISSTPTIAFPQAANDRSDQMLVQVSMADTDRHFVFATTVDDRVQVVSIAERSGDTGMVVADLDLYSTGKFDPSIFKRGQQIVTADNGSGYFAQIPETGYPGAEQVAPVPTLAWEYHPGVWATLNANPPLLRGATTVDEFRDRLLAIAYQLRFADLEPLRIPYRLGYLPSGTRITGGTPSLDPTRPRSEVNLTDSATGQSRLTLDASPKGLFSFNPNTTINGHPALVTGTGGLWLDLGTCHLFFSAKRDSDTAVFPLTEIKNIAAAITGAEVWDDPDSWYDYRQATPPK